jgi:ABC-2 type transport system permease protein
MTTAAEASAPARRPVRPFYWSLRRELWENRAIYLAPLAVAGVVLLGFVVAFRHRLGAMHLVLQRTAELKGVQGFPTAAVALKKLALARAEGGLVFPYAAAGGGLMLVAIAVAVFYALACLHAERRDRSVLFWKSLPVSDRTTVLSKAVTALVVLPIVAWGVIMATQVLLLALDTAVLSINGIDPAELWSRLHPAHTWTMISWSLVVMAAWNAPVIGWLMLVSACAKRGAFLWALVPPAAACLFEWIALNSVHVFLFLRHRLAESVEVGFSSAPGTQDAFGVHALDPVGFLSHPGLWGGLIVFAVFLAGCVWLRRRQDPI